MSALFNGSDTAVNAGPIDPATVNTEGLTIMGWGRFDAAGNDPRMLAKASSTATADHVWTLTRADGTGLPRFRLLTNAVTTLNGSTVIPLGEWTHLVGVFDGDLNFMRIYFNGVQDAETSKGFSLVTNTDEVWIGAIPPTVGARPMTGAVEDVRIYTRALGTQEIETIYASRGKDGITDGLFARWPLQDLGEGQTLSQAADISNNGFLGAAIGSPTFSSGITVNRMRPHHPIGL